MASSIPQQFTVADILDWNAKKQLELNPYFQRRAVWLESAQVYLIDTILLGLPVPKFYLRVKLNLETKKQIREIVDGQQRLRAIIEFSSDNLTLTSRSRQFCGKTYSQLDDETKQSFLSYNLSFDQLINANDDDILEIFSRLNSYTVTLNAPELRHAQFQGNFKWSIHNKAKDSGILWDSFAVLSTRERVRMLDESLIAEMYGILLQGVDDGGQARITRMYKKYDQDEELTDEAIREVEKKFDKVVRFISENLSDVLQAKSPISGGPHFLMLFAAIAHLLVGIPQGGLERELPIRPITSRISMAESKRALLKIAEIISSDDPPKDYREFWIASKITTQRIASRRVRFPVYWNALKIKPQ